MFYLSHTVVWSFSVCAPIAYILLICSIVIYLLPAARLMPRNNSKKTEIFEFNSAKNVLSLLYIAIALMALVVFFWVNAPVNAWYGHVYFGQFQIRVFLGVAVWFLFIFKITLSTLNLSSKLSYDYILVYVHLFFWIIILFQVSTLISLIFVIELLSTLVLLLLATSAFSTNFFYTNQTFANNRYFANNLPSTHVQTLLIFFWISLITSINLFLFLIFFFNKFSTFDWLLLESVFNYLTIVQEIHDTFSMALIWYNIFFCLFLKCGVAPFFFWKPNFFKGLPLRVLCAYICFFYFFLILYFMYFLIVSASDLFYFYAKINLGVVTIGIVFLFLSLNESYYVKTFLALSSILNTLFVFLALSGSTLFTINLLF